MKTTQRRTFSTAASHSTNLHMWMPNINSAEATLFCHRLREWEVFLQVVIKPEILYFLIWPKYWHRIFVKYVGTESFLNPLKMVQECVSNCKCGEDCPLSNYKRSEIVFILVSFAVVPLIWRILTVFSNFLKKKKTSQSLLLKINPHQLHNGQDVILITSTVWSASIAREPLNTLETYYSIFYSSRSYTGLNAITNITQKTIIFDH